MIRNPQILMLLLTVASGSTAFSATPPDLSPKSGVCQAALYRDSHGSPDALASILAGNGGCPPPQGTADARRVMELATPAKDFLMNDLSARVKQRILSNPAAPRAMEGLVGGLSSLGQLDQLQAPETRKALALVADSCKAVPGGYLPGIMAPLISAQKGELTAGAKALQQDAGQYTQRYLIATLEAHRIQNILKTVMEKKLPPTDVTQSLFQRLKRLRETYPGVDLVQDRDFPASLKLATTFEVKDAEKPEPYKELDGALFGAGALQPLAADEKTAANPQAPRGELYKLFLNRIMKTQYGDRTREKAFVMQRVGGALKLGLEGMASVCKEDPCTTVRSRLGLAQELVGRMSGNDQLFAEQGVCGCTAAAEHEGGSSFLRSAGGLTAGVGALGMTAATGACVIFWFSGCPVWGPALVAGSTAMVVAGSAASAVSHGLDSYAAYENYQGRKADAKLALAGGPGGGAEQEALRSQVQGQAELAQAGRSLAMAGLSTAGAVGGGLAGVAMRSGIASAAVARVEAIVGTRLTPDEVQRLADAQKVLGGDPLSEKTQAAIIRAHRVGQGATGQNGAPAGVIRAPDGTFKTNYTTAQWEEKLRKLQGDGSDLTPLQAKALMRANVAGDVLPTEKEAELVARVADAAKHVDRGDAAYTEEYNKAQLALQEERMAQLSPGAKRSTDGALELNFSSGGGASGSGARPEVMARLSEESAKAASGIDGKASIARSYWSAAARNHATHGDDLLRTSELFNPGREADLQRFIASHPAEVKAAAQAYTHAADVVIRTGKPADYSEALELIDKSAKLTGNPSLRTQYIEDLQEHVLAAEKGNLYTHGNNLGVLNRMRDTVAFLRSGAVAESKAPINQAELDRVAQDIEKKIAGYRAALPQQQRSLEVSTVDARLTADVDKAKQALREQQKNNGSNSMLTTVEIKEKNRYLGIADVLKGQGERLTAPGIPTTVEQTRNAAQVFREAAVNLAWSKEPDRIREGMELMGRAGGLAEKAGVQARTLAWRAEYIENVQRMLVELDQSQKILPSQARAKQIEAIGKLLETFKASQPH